MPSKRNLLLLRAVIAIGFLFLTVALVCLLVLVMSGVPDKECRREKETEDTITQSAMATNSFGISLLKALPKEDNMVFSPFSVSTALWMAHFGAKGNTGRQLQLALGLDDANVEAVNDMQLALKQIRDNLVDPDFREYILCLANVALTRNDHNILDTHVNSVKNFYGGELEKFNFSHNGKEIQETINEWISEKCRGNVKELLDHPPDSNTSLLFLSTVYFKAAWPDFFSFIPDYGAFYNSRRADAEAEKSKKIQMMFLKGRLHNAKYGWSEELDSFLLELPFSENILSLVIILPESQDGLEQLENKLTHKNLHQAIKNLKPVLSPMSVGIPKFKLEPKMYSLRTFLQHLGITEAFLPEAADFSGFDGELYGQLIYLSDIQHKIGLKIEEGGAEASPATLGYVTPRKTSKSIEPDKKATFLANHPFIFLIRDQDSGIILFLGSIRNPSVRRKALPPLCAQDVCVE